MKTKKKLSLSKHTVSRLNDIDLNSAKGGTTSDPTWEAACGPTDMDCPNTRFCPTNGCVTIAYVKTYCNVHYEEGF